MWVYLLIMVAKIVEVALMTIRVVLITKGERRVGSVIGFFEVLLWIYIANTVLTGVSEDPLKAVFYALGFALGNFVGSKIEEFIGLGLSEVQIIVKEEDGLELATVIRDKGFAVTIVEGMGKNSKRNILFMFVKRKRVKAAVELIKSYQENVVITVSETKPLYGGFGISTRQ